MRHGADFLILCGMIAVTASSLAADDTAPADKPPEDVRTILISPRAVERPLLKYRLFPAEYELQDGNAAPVLLRLPWDNLLYFSTVVPTFTDFLGLPLDDPKVLGSGDVFQQYGHLKRAAYMRNVNWEYPIGEVPLANILLPDVQGARDIVGRGLSVHIRHLIATGRLEEAREGILVGLAVSRHYGRTPFVITQLVCSVIDSMMLARVEELISQPGCPNLYWALSALPRPLIDLQSAVEMEQNMLPGSVEALTHLDELKTKDEWEAAARAVLELFADEGTSLESGKADLRVVRTAEWARARRSEWAGNDADRLDTMPDSEVAVRWLSHMYRDYTQEITAILSLEPEVAIPRLAELDDEVASAQSALDFPILFVLKNPLRIYLNVNGGHRRIDALRVVEAIRHYAATHEGRLPESLDQIDETPAPDDPLTGKPFHYDVNERVATLRADGFDVDGKQVGGVAYRIELRAAAD